MQVIADMKKQKESLSLAVDEFSLLKGRLDRWQEEKEKTKSNSNIDSCLEAYDPVSDQLVRLHAEQLAIEDTLYKLDNGIASDKKHPTLTLDSFIQQTRKLSRQHFFTKSHIEKINNKITILNMNN
jgi:ESCRT-I complex subunit TSG101